ncbi:MAG: PQQ-like beta-propeller repeat protein [Verrucomicrobiales bacterium]|nr:PQQ-like beta-propeller repeat protein [Verrucomicrobiales bacterium]MCP5527400.1 PQQ-like beta-propeller repeat protein [Verrucomicrobiales bacterium]
MKTSFRATAVRAVVLLASFAGSLHGQEWPQWLGPGRDGRIAGFTPPATWPAALARAWEVPAGPADASPVLADGRLFVVGREGNGEVTLCLDPANGETIWRDHYETEGATGPASRHPGPRSTPSVAHGKVVTFGVRGTLSCLDAASGKVLWRKNDFPGAWPRFFTSASPVIVNDLCVALVGGGGQGGIAAYELAGGDRRWLWSGDEPAYASPVLATVAGTEQIVALTATKVVGVRVTDGALLWEVPFAPRGRAYNAATPVVDGATVFVSGSGRGTKALRIEAVAAGFTARELWANNDAAVQFNTPLLKGGRLYGLSERGNFFCLDAATGALVWTDPKGGLGGYGCILDGGGVLLATTPNSELIVLSPGEAAYRELARIKVADQPVYGCPVVVGKRILVQDQNSVTAWQIE